MSDSETAARMGHRLAVAESLLKHIGSQVVAYSEARPGKRDRHLDSAEGATNVFISAELELGSLAPAERALLTEIAGT